MMQTGGRKNISIRQMLAKATIVAAGPQNMSIMVMERELSRIPKSLENLFKSIPEGVTSKNYIGLRTIPLIIFSWIFSLAMRIEMLRQQYLMTNKKKQRINNNPRIYQYRLKFQLKIFGKPSLMSMYIARKRKIKVVMHSLTKKRIIVVGSRK